MDIFKNIKKLSYYIFYSILLLLSALILIYTLYLLKPLNIPGEQFTFDIKKGENIHIISERLASQGIITNPVLMRKLLYLSNLDYTIYAGEYELKTGARVYDLIKKITSGDVKSHDLQIIEGSTLSELLQKFKASSTIKQTVDYNTDFAAVDTALLNKLKIVFKDYPELMIKIHELKTLEGVLFPDKYFYFKGESDVNLLKRSFLKMNDVLKSEWSNRKKPNDTIIKTPYNALIMASILEKESSDSADRQLVSGVVYNRLRDNMPLQVDPTVIYSLGNKYNGNLTKDDLKFQSKYNTYVNHGLPPGPIGFVSQNALHSALNPQEHNFIYFVSMGNGKHFFSATLDEHNLAVQKYQKNNLLTKPEEVKTQELESVKTDNLNSVKVNELYSTVKDKSHDPAASSKRSANKTSVEFIGSIDLQIKQAYQSSAQSKLSETKSASEIKSVSKDKKTSAKESASEKKTVPDKKPTSQKPVSHKKPDLEKEPVISRPKIINKNSDAAKSGPTGSKKTGKILRPASATKSSNSETKQKSLLGFSQDTFKSTNQASLKANDSNSSQRKTTVLIEHYTVKDSNINKNKSSS